MVYRKSKNFEKNVENSKGEQEVFYLEKIISQKNAENKARRQLEIDKLNRQCQKNEERDQKYIDELKAELLEKYKRAQENCQRKIDTAKKKALSKI